MGSLKFTDEIKTIFPKELDLGLAKSRFFLNPGIGIIPISNYQSRDWFFGIED